MCEYIDAVYRSIIREWAKILSKKSDKFAAFSCSLCNKVVSAAAAQCWRGPLNSTLSAVHAPLYVLVLLYIV